MKNTTQKILEWSLVGLGLLTIVFLIAFENKTDRTRRCEGVKIELSGQQEEHFINAEDIKSFITKNGMKPLEGKMLSEIVLSEVEKDILQIKQIQSCEVFGDLQGNINIIAKPYIPYARILKPSSKDCYMDNEGGFFPLSKYHSARVLLLSGSYFRHKNELDKVNDLSIINLVKRIKEDDFWNAQIAEINIDDKKNLKLVTLLGNQEIIFGKPENVENKLKKLMVYYNKILPTQDWDSFKQIDLQYKNQIVCRNS